MRPRYISINVREAECMHGEVGVHGPEGKLANISCYSSTIYSREQRPIGYMKSQLLTKGAMHIDGGLNGMWQECQAYDESHAPESKLDKVENYLSNESFYTDKQSLIDAAESVLFIEQVYIKPVYRGNGFGLLAIDCLINQLGVGERCIVLLQAGAINGAFDGRENCSMNPSEAHEKIARHWKRMGFDEWSYTDDAWLCLSTDKTQRPRIEGVVPNLFAD